ncbi:MAG TPA: hypothetical protein VG055_13505 [Planctomycetaceae bacterium]|jgi:hypothetical protein|nr:hypothetical protein [Planctomycetaceae bacterium]
MSTRALGPLKVQVKKLAEYPGEIGELGKALLILIDSVHHHSVQLYEFGEAVRSSKKTRSPSASPEHF